MIVLLAFLPLQAWAGIGTFVAGAGMMQAHQTADDANTVDAVDAARITLAAAAERVDVTDASDAGEQSAPGAQETSYPADNAEPSPPGADFAEQLLPAPLPRMATAVGRGVVPQYARTALPDPDLPLQPRPPRG